MPTSPELPRPEWRISLAETVLVVACSACLLLGPSATDNMLVPMLGFLVLTLLLARLFFYTYPIWGGFFFGRGEARPEADTHEARVAELTRAGLELVAEGRYAEGLGPLGEANALDPSRIDAVIALGRCYRKVGQLGRAVEVLERAEPEHHDDPGLHYDLACYWSQCGNPQRALYELAEAVRLDPGLIESAALEQDLEPIRGETGFARLDSRPMR